MSRTLSIDESTRLAGRALETLLAASTSPTRSVGEQVRRTIATNAGRVVMQAVMRSELRRRAERRRRIRRAVVAGVVVGAIVALKHRSSGEEVE
jgi:hypothetical protein